MFADVQHLHHVSQVARCSVLSLSLCFLSVFLSRARLPLSPLLSLSLSLSVLPRWSLVHDTPHTRSWVYGTGPQTRNRHPAERKPAAQTCCNRQVPPGTFRRTTRAQARPTRALTPRASTTRPSGRDLQRTLLAFGKRHALWSKPGRTPPTPCTKRC
jgi:hypothetical protein